MPDDFDPLGLARAPKLDVPGALALALRLLGAAPDCPTPSVRSTLDALAVARAELAGRATGFVHPPRGGSTRLGDDEATLAWRALHARLESYTQLPSDRYPNAVRAAALIARLFPTGLDFLRESAPSRQVDLGRRFALSREPEVASELCEVAGSDFTDALCRGMAVERPVERPAERRVEARLRVAAPAALPGVVSEAVAESLRSLRRAIASYLLQLVAMHDEGNSAARIAVRSAFRPVAELHSAGVDGGPSPARPAPRLAAMRHAG